MRHIEGFTLRAETAPVNFGGKDGVRRARRHRQLRLGQAQVLLHGRKLAQLQARRLHRAAARAEVRHLPATPGSSDENGSVAAGAECGEGKGVPSRHAERSHNHRRYISTKCTEWRNIGLCHPACQWQRKPPRLQPGLNLLQKLHVLGLRVLKPDELGLRAREAMHRPGETAGFQEVLLLVCDIRRA